MATPPPAVDASVCGAAGAVRLVAAPSAGDGGHAASSLGGRDATETELFWSDDPLNDSAPSGSRTKPMPARTEAPEGGEARATAEGMAEGMALCDCATGAAVHAGGGTPGRLSFVLVPPDD
jgi:hypothetical protein